jgi:hypothetical protein
MRKGGRLVGCGNDAGSRGIGRGRCCGAKYPQPTDGQVEYTGVEGWVGLLEKRPRADEGRFEVVEERVRSREEVVSLQTDESGE